MSIPDLHDEMVQALAAADLVVARAVRVGVGRVSGLWVCRAFWCHIPTLDSTRMPTQPTLPIAVGSPDSARQRIGRSAGAWRR